MLWGDGEAGTLVRCWRGWKMVQLLWKIAWWSLRKLNIESSCDPAIPLLGMYAKELTPGAQRENRTVVFTAALFTTAKRQKQPECSSVGKWIKKRWCIYTMGCCLNKKAILSCATTWINCEDFMLSEKKPAREGQIGHGSIYMRSLKESNA